MVTFVYLNVDGGVVVKNVVFVVVFAIFATIDINAATDIVAAIDTVMGMWQNLRYKLSRERDD